MEINEIVSAIEAILFASGESVPINLVWLHNSADSLLKLVTVEIAKVFQGVFDYILDGVKQQ